MEMVVQLEEEFKREGGKPNMTGDTTTSKQQGKKPIEPS